MTANFSKNGSPGSPRKVELHVDHGSAEDFESSLSSVFGARRAAPPQMSTLGDGLKQAAMSPTAWAKTVQEVLPLLDKAGVRQALKILDVAQTFARQATMLDEILANMPMEKQDVAAMYYRRTAEGMREEVVVKRQMLLRELHNLPYRGIEPFAAAAGLLNQPSLSIAPQSDAVLQELSEVLNSQLAEASAIGAAAARLSGYSMGMPATIPMPAEPTMENESYMDEGAEEEEEEEAPDSSEPAVAEAASSYEDSHWTMEGFYHPKGKDIASQQTLSSSLQLLSEADPRLVFVVRRINKMGFKACRLLKRHYSYYGHVVRVLLAHSTVKSQDEDQLCSRRRPSSLGFVQMGSVAAVQRILAMGEDQWVDMFPIRVTRFDRRAQDMPDQADESEVQCKLDGKFDRQHTAHSSGSQYSGKTSASTASISSGSKSDDQSSS
eukprot:TRINITY_DN91886_c0_g1_i1.p1 TRINITY_DN91886_c0_g1~~TRINITY_DN91886_c0_g1_i1.p1  ORF type:complete len:437 (-),score=92.16 TRINITY_DN91886_c0_g1_i1:298-1608(-)